ncbi:NAD-dependent epimerase/dehydratase family protein [Mesorhizobium calcicola]|uniref:NAD-dependent epimerase/dehydratase family protein n=1 Tax=Mesorhizobium calcicola TaxID=1300310 RepID=A0ABW4WK53_9HYPH
MKVLVTGATGFIGRLVAHHLREAGVELRLASRHPERLGSGNEAVLMPGFDAPAAAFLELTRGVTHVVHCAGLNNDQGNATEADYRAANVELSARLAHAAATQASGRFIHLSSIRAVIGARVSATIDENTLPAPQCLYGRTKREGEIKVLDAFASHGRSDAAVLRLPPVYGSGMKGNLATLMRLADTALPLPTGALTGIRSLMSSEAAARAVSHLLSHPGSLRPIYVGADVPPVAVAAIIAAFRSAFGRPMRLMAVPASLMRPAAAVLGRRAFWDGMTATQICDPALLMSQGWAPETGTLERLAELARLSKSRLLV